MVYSNKNINIKSFKVLENIFDIPESNNNYQLRTLRLSNDGFLVPIIPRFNLFNHQLPSLPLLNHQQLPELTLSNNIHLQRLECMHNELLPLILE